MSGNITIKDDFSPVKTVTEWAKVISTSWYHATEQILDVAHQILNAEEQLSPTEIRELKTDHLPFGIGTYSKLKKIGMNVNVTNPDNLQYLPNSFSTIYELTHLSDKDFNQAIDDGTLTTDLKRASVSQLTTRKKPMNPPDVPTNLVIIQGTTSLSKSNAKTIKSYIDEISKMEGISKVTLSAEFRKKI